jgi:hypothetical protein
MAGSDDGCSVRLPTALTPAPVQDQRGNFSAAGTLPAAVNVALRVAKGDHLARAARLGTATRYP